MRRTFGKRTHNVYLCAECGFWHIGNAVHNNARMKALARARKAK